MHVHKRAEPLLIVIIQNVLIELGYKAHYVTNDVLMQYTQFVYTYIMYAIHHV